MHAPLLNVRATSGIQLEELEDRAVYRHDRRELVRDVMASSVYLDALNLIVLENLSLPQDFACHVVTAQSVSARVLACVHKSTHVYIYIYIYIYAYIHA
jgi:hypothetical protein